MNPSSMLSRCSYRASGPAARSWTPSRSSGLVAVAFWSRLLPIVRTFISFPAGAARVPLGLFSLYTFLGSVIWSLALAYVGVVLGEHWHDIRRVMRGFDLVVVAALLVAFVLWARHHFRAEHAETDSDGRTDRPA